MDSCCYKTAFKNAEPQVDCAECCDDSYDFDWGAGCICTPCNPTKENPVCDIAKEPLKKLENVKKTYTIIDI